MQRFFTTFLFGVISLLLSSQVAFAAPGDLAWTPIDIANPSVFDDEYNNITDSAERYIFTAVVADGNYFYTARSHKGPWTEAGGGSIQKWNAADGALAVSDFTCGCLGIYNLELKVYNGDGLGLVRLYVYKPGKLEIWNKDTLLPLAGADDIDDATAPLCSSALGNTPCNNSVANPEAFDGSISKRTKIRGDGTTVFAEQTGPTSINEMTLSLGASTIASESTWATDIVPAPSWHIDLSSSRYFGVEAIALSSDHDYVYIVGGREDAGVYSSRIEKRELGALAAPAVNITSVPSSLPYGGGNITLEWSSVDADSCDISSDNPPGIIFTGISGSEPVSVTTNTTFTADCTRTSDGASGSDSVVVTVPLSQLPIAVISEPPSDIAIIEGDTVNFVGDTSYDPEDGSVSGYDWRSIDSAMVGASCSTATNFSNAANPSYTFSTKGVYNVYLVVEDSDGGLSSCAQRVITVPPQCSDEIDNDGDGDTDSDDTGCHTDEDAGNPATYVGSDDSEANCGDGICSKIDGEAFNSCRLDCRIFFNNF